MKVKRYKSGSNKACRSRLIISVFGILAAASIIGVAMYYFFRYGYEQQMYDRIIAAEMQADAESKNYNERKIYKKTL